MQQKNKICVLTTKSNIEGCSFVNVHKFRSGHKAPVYDIKTISAFNQIIGFSKFVNSEYSNVYYRGVSGLYDNMLPKLMRKRTKGIPDDLSVLLKNITSNDFFIDSLKLRKTFRPQSSKDYTENNRIQRFNKYTVEALLQHYVGKTRFLDVVDNHWIALWMGLQQFHMHGKSNEYCKCIKRSLSIGECLEHLYTKRFLPNDDIYLYVMLVAMPHAISKPMFGITETESFVEVDLRKALPSFYLRPHAQHALVVRRLDKHNERADAEYYDMANQVVGILRVRIDIADEWLGHGKLMTQENIFPSPSVDQGYNTLLMKNEIFTHPYQIVKYF